MDGFQWFIQALILRAFLICEYLESFDSLQGAPKLTESRDHFVKFLNLTIISTFTNQKILKDKCVFNLILPKADQKPLEYKTKHADAER